MDNHNREILDKWMNEYGTEVLRTAFFYVKDQHIAEDIFQEVFLKIYKKANTYRGTASIRTWILKITVNQCKDYLKSKWFKRILLKFELQNSDQIETDSTVIPEDAILDSERGQELLEQILKISIPLREVLILYYYNDLSQGEIAEILKIPAGTVRSRLHRAKNALKERLRSGGSYDEEF